MPDLDLIKQAEQGMHALRQGEFSDLERADEDCNQCGDSAAGLLQEQQAARRRFNEWLWPSRLLGARPTTSRSRGCLVVVGETAEGARQAGTARQNELEFARPLRARRLG